SLPAAGVKAEIARRPDLLEPGAELQRQEVGFFVARQQEVPALARVLTQPARDDEKLVQHLRLDLAAVGAQVGGLWREEARGHVQSEFRLAEAFSKHGALLDEAAAGEQKELQVGLMPRRTGRDDVE